MVVKFADCQAVYKNLTIAMYQQKRFEISTFEIASYS